MRECPSCGAPWKSGTERVCSYCQYELAAPIRTARTGAPRATGGSAPPVAVVLVLGGLLMSVAVAVVVGLVVFRSEPSPAPSATVSPAPRPPPRPSYRGPACPLGDVDGDGIHDYAAMLGSPGRNRVVRLSGADGTVLTPDGLGTSFDRNHTWAFCPGEGWFGMIEDGPMSMALFHGEMLQPVVTRAFPIRPNGVTHGESCFRIHLVDRSEQGFSLVDGAETECDAPGRNRAFGLGLDNAFWASGTAPARDSCLEDGSLCFEVDNQTRAGFLRVSARSGEQERWSVELRFRRPGRALALVPTPDTLVVLGQRRSAEGGGMFAIGLDPSSGRERYATQIGHDRVRLVDWSGRHVVISQRILTALDASTGEIAWRVGR